MFGYQWVIWHCSAVHIDDVIVFVLILSHGTLFSFFSATLLKRKIKPSQLPGCVTKQQHSSSPPPPPPPHTNFMTFKDENTMKVCFEEFYMSCWCRNKKEMPSISSPLPWKKESPTAEDFMCFKFVWDQQKNHVVIISNCSYLGWK